ncbi:MAG: hypothetical protein ACI8PZ_002855 [Myxococcota bacterium]|jgi:hypothetical protein
MVRLTCLVALAGCLGGSPPPPAPALDEAIPDQPEAEAPHDRPVASDISAGDERSYATRWLVVVQRTVDPEVPFDRLDELKAVETVDAKPVRLYSSHLNGLRPCQHIVVARAYDRREEARYFGHKLTLAGFDVEVIQAGEHAPLDGRVEAWCETSRLSVPSECPSDLHFVLAHGGMQWLDLDLSPGEVARAMVDAEPLAVDPKDSAWWSTALEQKGVGTAVMGDTEPGDAAQFAHMVGDVWRGVGASDEAVECEVTGFSVVTRGTPHHRDAKDAKSPTCGVPRMLAQLNCSEPVTWAVPELVELPTRYVRATDREPTPIAMAKVMVTLTDSDLYTRVRAITREATDANRALLDEATDIQLYKSADGREVLLVEGTLRTGEGKATCGRSDVNARIVGVVDSRGAVLSEFREFSGSVDGLIDVDGDGRPELLQQQWPAMPTLFAAGGDLLCRVPTGYCDSPCTSSL